MNSTEHGLHWSKSTLQIKDSQMSSELRHLILRRGTLFKLNIEGFELCPFPIKPYQLIVSLLSSKLGIKCAQKCLYKYNQT